MGFIVFIIVFIFAGCPTDVICGSIVAVFTRFTNDILFITISVMLVDDILFDTDWDISYLAGIIKPYLTFGARLIVG